MISIIDVLYSIQSTEYLILPFFKSRINYIISLSCLIPKNQNELDIFIPCLEIISKCRPTTATGQFECHCTMLIF